MSRIVVDMSPSVDGFVAGPGVGVERPMGRAGHRLHRWIGFDGGEPAPPDRDAAAAVFAGAGAVLLGRTMFDVGIGTWGPDGAFGLPCVVVTGRPHADVVRGPTTFTFATDGLDDAVEAARRAAGGRDVVVVGGARLVQQCLDRDLVDELRLHVAPVLLGSGTALFGSGPRRELTCTRTVTTPEATHLTFGRV